jgi:SAM-dependent methyltransferase
MSLDQNNPYTTMQKAWYEAESSMMRVENHQFHDSNPDYNSILFGSVVENPDRWKEKTALEFGCGCGRNVLNLSALASWSRVDGCDISEENIRFCGTLASSTSQFFVTSGIDCGKTLDKSYDFVFSTIVLQHICVHEIRLAILKDIYRVLKPGGTFSFQMGYDGPDAESKIAEIPVLSGNQRDRNYTRIQYFENRYSEVKTNSHADTMVENPEFLVSDLKSVGFRDISFQIRRPWCDDKHPAWIFVSCSK